jgi:tripeptidyl-peptidase-1
MRVSSISLVALALGSAVASPVRRNGYALKESHFVPKSWTQVERAQPEHVVYLQIGLKQNNFAELERQLLESQY